MNRSSLFSALKSWLFLIFVAATALSQTDNKPSAGPPSPPPGNIRLPEGFVHTRGRGIDSAVGSIIRSDGFAIKYDIGRMAGNYADQYFPAHFEALKRQTHLNTTAIENQIKYLQDQMVWRRRQHINGYDVMIVMLKDAKLIASYVDSNSNFIATADTSDKVLDFFLIVTTYQSKPGSSTK